MTMVEIMVALSVLVVAASIFCQTLVSTANLRQLNHENTLAADAARVVLERMRNEPFLEVYRDYNEEPKDDPGGVGTGPGNLFEVEGLRALEGAPGNKPGRVYFPSKEFVAASGTGGGGKKPGQFGTGGGTTTTGWQLVENFVDPGLGMPRDLNGDNVVDGTPKSTTYIILPVRIRIEWQSRSGPRRFEIVTQLGNFPRKVLE